MKWWVWVLLVIVVILGLSGISRANIAGEDSPLAPASKQAEPDWCGARFSDYVTLDTALTLCKLQQARNACCLANEGPGNDGDKWLESLFSDTCPFDLKSIALFSQAWEINQLSKLLVAQRGVCQPCNFSENNLEATRIAFYGCVLRLESCGSRYDPFYGINLPLKTLPAPDPSSRRGITHVN